MRRLIAILRQRCPSCLRGQIFTGQIAMRRACDQCPNVFEREEGYFIGALYFSYPLALVILLGFGIPLWAVLPVEIETATLLAWIFLVALVPYVFRMSRTLWMHFDHLVGVHVGGEPSRPLRIVDARGRAPQ